MRGRTLLRVAWVVVATAGAFAACDTPATLFPCTGIPDGGCPRQYGVSCADPACTAIYLCRTGNVWELERTCPVRDASTPEVGPVDAGTLRDVDTDVQGAWGGPGCGALQPPDCMLGTAAACGGQLGCCGCEDLFVCRDGGWEPWGLCGPNGPVPQ